MSVNGSTEKLKLTINQDSPVAVYRQIAEHVLAGVASGRINPGDTLPSVREMVQSTGVNPNTVIKGYHDLVMVGALKAYRGTGYMVTVKAKKIAADHVRISLNRLRAEFAHYMDCGLGVEGMDKGFLRIVDATNQA